MVTYKLAEHILEDYVFVVRRIRSISRREQSAEWLLSQLSSVIPALYHLEDDFYRRAAATVCFAVLDLLTFYRSDHRYIKFSTLFRFWATRYNITASRSGYLRRVKPLGVYDASS